jgi:hypothetical protein
MIVRETHNVLYVRPVLTYGSERCLLKRKDENILQMFERISGPIKENGVWRSRYNHELDKLHNTPDIVKVIKVGQLR